MELFDFDKAKLFHHDPTTGTLIRGAHVMVAKKQDLASVLREDFGGVELMRLKQELRRDRDELFADRNLSNRDGIAKAFDAGIALLPEIWRLEQRK